MKKLSGFTLIEVLIALAIIAIALTALLKATSQSTVFTQRIKDKTASHWVAMEALNSIKTGLIKIGSGNNVEHATNLMGRTWRWQATISSTPIHHMEQISIDVIDASQSGNRYSLIGYRHTL